MKTAHHTYHIKNMVCPRCVMVVRDSFNKLGFDVRKAELGKVEAVRPADITTDEINQKLKAHGFELLFDKEDQLHEEIKHTLLHYLEKVETGGKMPRLSEWLSKQLGHSYSGLSKLFSEKEGDTISGYYIKLKIERVKELLSYGEFTLSEIAWKLGYSSVQHLSNQFRDVTGRSVSEYKSSAVDKRRMGYGV